MTQQGGLVKVILSSRSDSLMTLANNVGKGESLEKKQFDFADNLYLGDYYEEASELLNLILKKHPNNIDALILKAKTLLYLNDPDEAEDIIQGILAKEDKNIEALSVLNNIIQEFEDWERLLQTTTFSLEIVEKYSNEWVFFMKQHTIAHIELGNHQDAEQCLKEMEQHGGDRWGKWIANHLRDVYYTET